MRAGYRIAQFLHALFDQPDHDSLQGVRDQLGPSLWRLFCRLPRPEQAHALRVYRALVAQGQTQPDLLAAALLHDVGKTKSSGSTLGKVAVVLARAVAPQAAKRWGSGTSRGWRKPFAVAVRHPSWGARMILEAGGSKRMADLVERHHEPRLATSSTPRERALLKALKSADGQN